MLMSIKKVIKRVGWCRLSDGGERGVNIFGFIGLGLNLK